MRTGAFVLIAVTVTLIGLPFTLSWTLGEVAFSLAITAVFLGTIEVVNHRYFSHRAFATHRATQFVMAVLSVLTFQRSALWWASTHRHHHAHSDRAEDCHSPRHGFLHAYWAWLFRSPCAEIQPKLVRDLTVFPELLLLDWIHPLVNAAYVFGIWYALGFKALAIAFVIPLGLSTHIIFGTNYFCHLEGFGYRRHETRDGSRNSYIFGLLAAGQGWHNNHHKFPSDARAGQTATELDWGYLIILGLEFFGLVWDVRRPDRPRALEPLLRAPARAPSLSYAGAPQVDAGED